MLVTVQEGAGLLLRLFVAWQLLWGLVAFVSVWRDKRLAQQGRARLPERQLHALEAWGGWLGSWAAQLVFRHKTRKRTYQRIFRRRMLWWSAAWVLGLLASVALHRGLFN
ncbi:DUF1294 domain-containing protein [Deinococcus taeanensis]|uniref:DUF1294 domain-containing protein n=1 Tax=Deinococcus taeanensis TaxID=2737050 RepID=UPI001CDCE725|nr:DUF1294 domain-containing protein [Deinococcus taeanensis]UBV43721.1 DUF1294 domain-containing protein [Deinococcus taeanensis]